MKFELMFKTPDVLDQLGGDEEKESLAREFVTSDEYLTVEFDTEALTAEIVRG